MEEIRFARVATNGISLHVAQAGPENGPLVILLLAFQKQLVRGLTAGAVKG